MKKLSSETFRLDSSIEIKNWNSYKSINTYHPNIICNSRRQLIKHQTDILLSFQTDDILLSFQIVYAIYVWSINTLQIWSKQLSAALQSVALECDDRLKERSHCATVFLFITLIVCWTSTKSDSIHNFFKVQNQGWHCDLLWKFILVLKVRYFCESSQFLQGTTSTVTQWPLVKVHYSSESSLYFWKFTFFSRYNINSDTAEDAGLSF